MLELNVDMDSISIEGQKVVRPNWISRHNWLQYWEAIQRVSQTGCSKSACNIIIPVMVV